MRIKRQQFVRAIVSAAVLAALAGTAKAGTFDSWGWSMKLTFTNYTQPETLTNFPVLVVLSNNVGNSGFSYDDFLSGSNDLRFAASNMAEALDFEIELWNTNGASYIWVKVPQIVGSNDYIYALWGCLTNAPPCGTNGSTWSANYRGVWHFTADPALTNRLNDSSPNMRNLVHSGGPLATNGQIGKGLNFDNANDKATGTLSTVNAPFTVELWVYFASLNQPAGDYDYTVQLQNGGVSAMSISRYASDNRYYSADGPNPRYGPALPGQQWLHIVQVNQTDSPYHQMWLNGVKQTVSNTTAQVNTDGNIFLGLYNPLSTHWLNGKLDEVRVSDVTRSSNWIWTCWANQSAGSAFLNYGAVLSLGVRVQALQPSGLTPTGATLAGRVVGTGDAENPAVYFCWGDEDAGTNAFPGAWDHADYQGTNWGQGQSFSTNIGDLLSGSTYVVRCYASNTTGSAWSDPQTFTTIYAPAVTNLGAQDISVESAGLSGAIVDTGGENPLVWLEYWASAGGATSTVAIGPRGGAFTNRVGDLLPSTEYVYRILASNAAGYAWSMVSNFTTRAGIFVALSGDGSDGTTWATAFTNLQPAVNTALVAGAGSVILVKYGTYTNSANVSISNHPGLTIRGGYLGSGFDTSNLPTVITRNTAVAEMRILYVQSSTVTVERLAISGGYLKGSTWGPTPGAGAYALNSSVVLTNVMFANNMLDTYLHDHRGGGLALENGTAVIAGCVFSNNVNNGAVEGYGGCLHVNNVNPLTIRNSLFTGNYLAGCGDWRGSAIYFTGAAATATVESCLFLNNNNAARTAQVTADIYVESAALLTLRNTQIQYGSGQGIYKSGAGSLNVFHCLIANCVSDGIRVNTGTVAVANTTLADNYGWGLTNSGVTLGTISNSIVWNNSAGGIAGSVTSDYTCAQEAHAGAGNLTADPIFTMGYYLATNSLPFQTANSPCIDAGGATAAGLGLDTRTTRTDGSNDWGTVDLGYHFTNAVANISNSVLYVDVVTGSDTNTGWNPGEALKTLTNALAKAIRCSTINVATGVYSPASGEVFPLVIRAPDLTIRGADRYTTTVNASLSNRAFQASCMGNLRFEGLTITNGNSAYGPGINLLFCRTMVANCILANNGKTPASYGCGIYAVSSFLTVTNSSFVNNGPAGYQGWTVGQGGAIYASACPSVVLVDNLFKGNSLNGYDYSYGSALYISGGQLQIMNCRFTDHYLSSYYSSGTLDLRGLASLAVSNCVFSNNYTAVNSGGGMIYVSGSGVNGMRITDCTMLDNRFNLNTSFGVVMESLTGGQLSLQRCALGRNSRHGVLKSGTATVSLTNCLIFAQTNHGVLATAGTLSLGNCTLVRNGGWGATNSGASMTLGNSIAWDNTLGGVANCTATYSDLQDPPAGIGNTNVNPGFVDTTYFHLESKGGHYVDGWFGGGSWGQSLTANSPLIDAGDPTLGWSGEPDPNGERVNVGAYANTPVASKTFITEPGVFTNLRVHAYPVTNVGPDYACFNGRVLGTNGAENPQTFFCWSYSDQGTSATGLWNMVSMGARAQWELFTTNVGGFTTSVVYRCFVTNSLGMSWSSNAISFDLLEPPTITNNGATAVRRRSAVLNGSVTNTEFGHPWCWFYYWTNNAPASNVVAVGQQTADFSAGIVSLTPGLPYNFQILASNNAGITWSDIKDFTTLDTSARGWYFATNGANTVGTNWSTALTNIYDTMAIPELGDTAYLASHTFMPTSQLAWSGSSLIMRGGYTAASDLDLPGSKGLPTIIKRTAASTNRIFYFTNSVITLDYITISNGMGVASDGSGYARGAGLYAVGCNVTLTNCILAWNRLPGGYYEEGGGIYAAGSALSIFGGRLSDNGQVNHGDGNTRGSSGGAICAVNCTSAFVNVLFERNEEGCYNYSYGQCLWISGGRFAASGCQFASNKSTAATAHVNGLFQFDSAQLIFISNCVFAANYHYDSSGAGGLFYITGSANGNELVNSVIQANTEVAGAGILSVGSAGGTMVLKNCIFNSNSNNCAAVYKAGASALSLTNCLIYGQPSHGARMAGGTLALGNCTIVTNAGWGVTNSAGTVTMKNSIVWDNRLGGIAGAATATYSDVQGGYTGTGNLDPAADPRFADPAGRDFKLRAGSPCLNVGLDEPWMATDRDLAGERRKVGAVDMGCYEYQRSPGTVFTMH